MKTTFSIFFILLCASALAQSGNAAGKNDFFGYLNGTRLDSINAHYAVAYISNKVIKKPDENGINSPYVEPSQLCFSFQVEDRKQDMYIRDNKGQTVSFSGNIAATLNFLYYNGWELVKILDDDPSFQYSTAQNSYFLLRKKDTYSVALQ